MYKISILSLICLLSVLAGCDSMPRKEVAVQANSNNIGVELNNLFQNYTNLANTSVPGNFEFNYTPVAGYSNKDQIAGTFELFSTDEKQHFFTPGAYTINNKSSLAYAMFVSGIVDEVYKRYGSQYELLVLADFWGSTDSSPFYGYVPYKGEFGDIDISKEDLLINGFEPNSNFTLTQGDALNNERLAVLRSYSIAWSIKHWPNRNKEALAKIEQSRFIASTSDNYGSAFRFAKVVIKVKRR